MNIGYNPNGMTVTPRASPINFIDQPNPFINALLKSAAMAMNGYNDYRRLGLEEKMYDRRLARETAADKASDRERSERKTRYEQHLRDMADIAGRRAQADRKSAENDEAKLKHDIARLDEERRQNDLTALGSVLRSIGDSGDGNLGEVIKQILTRIDGGGDAGLPAAPSTTTAVNTPDAARQSRTLSPAALATEQQRRMNMLPSMNDLKLGQGYDLGDDHGTGLWINEDERKQVTGSREGAAAFLNRVIRSGKYSPERLKSVADKIRLMHPPVDDAE